MNALQTPCRTWIINQMGEKTRDTVVQNKEQTCTDVSMCVAVGYSHILLAQFCYNFKYRPAILSKRKGNVQHTVSQAYTNEFASKPSSTHYRIH